ncbi:sulfotransferase family 2 domain-containing protein [Shewanella dokdonensis]|uniref:Sulfotransferase family 2 domain-containing protein n=1 Tax=Shewanella dokdonensis TaxID=712036 RepID=A0ABX8DD41_9GAMM|nr:sulfotransferase family 2 domain-containing protein [Shewanella dokdonensis]MCL1074481.1 sulfotransferase family 2 domain-containing protein [Shewanella dokdonensis]QVK22483.1 sulfotransferase family 2 domain-containing protein [Shewanella dokdonensis]
MKPLRFLHIPKTAGTTFTDVLKLQYFRQKKFEFSGNRVLDIKKFESLPESDREKIVLFYGHAPIVTGVNHADNATIITFIREPINRVKSFCQHVSEGKSSCLIDDFPPKTFNLDTFLESGYGELSNLQTQMLINHWGKSESSISINNMPASEAIDMALYNLFNRVSYFGLQEYFDESLIMFSSAMNWRLPLYSAGNKKDSRKLIQFESRHIERIAELNAIDIEVYKIAKERFLSNINSATFDNKKLKSFQLMNIPASVFIKSGIKIMRLRKDLNRS